MRARSGPKSLGGLCSEIDDILSLYKRNSSHMQNSAVLWGVGAVVVVAAGVGVWMYSGAGSGTPVSEGTPQEEAASAAAEPQPQSLKSLISYQGSQKCTFTSATATSDSSGTVYVANGTMRGDFVSTSAGRTIQSHMIVQGNTSYVWSDATPGGFKMSFDSTSSAGTASQGPIDPNTPASYSCEAWSPDTSVFAVPASIQFQDLTSLQAPTP